MKSDCLVISPVYNEEKYLNAFYAALRRVYSQDVVFVDDGSDDKSSGFLDEKKGPFTFIVRHTKRKGYGAALISGFNFAKENHYSKIVTLDVDLQHKPSHIPYFFEKLGEFEAVLGSRYLKPGRHLDVPQDRFLINRYISNLIRVEFGMSFTDPFCGLRAYSLDFLEKVNFSIPGYGIALEILLQIISKKVRFCELPVEAIYFKNKRKFLDNLENPRLRLMYYLEVISQETEKIYGKEKVACPFALGNQKFA